MRLRSLAIAVALAAPSVPALGQTTRPSTGDWLEYHYATGGKVVTLAPADASRGSPVNRDIVGARVIRPDGSIGEWLPVGEPATRPTTVPVVVAGRTVRKAPAVGIRGDGWTPPAIPPGVAAGPIVLRDMTIDGWKQNIVIVDDPRPVLIDGVISINAFRDEPSQVFQGQGGYLSHHGPATIRNCLFANNGWQDGKPYPNRNGFRHGFYDNVGSEPTTFEGCIFVGNAGAGAQTRSPGAYFKNCTFIANGINAIAVNTATFDGCTFIGATRYVELGEDNKPKATQGNSAILAYDTVRLKNCWFIGVPGQNDPDPRLPGIPTYNAGALAIGTNHRDNPGKTGSFVDLGGNRIIAWPEASPGQGFAGAPDVVAAAKAANPRGLYQALPGIQYGGNAVLLDYSATIGLVLAEKATPEQAAAAIATAARELAK